MKSIKNIMWGLFFLLAAGFVIVGSMGYFGNISVWTIVFSCFLAIWFVNGLVRLSWGNMLFPLAFGAILYDEVLGIEKLTPWPVLVAALLGTIGLSMIFKSKENRFPKKRVKEMVDEWKADGTVVEEMDTDDTTFNCEVAFGSAVKYVNCQQLRKGCVENSFGNLVLYFDNALLHNGFAEVKVETSFGKTILYIPKEWCVEVKITKAFGSSSEKGKCQVESENRLIINGEVAFGNMEIVYI